MTIEHVRIREAIAEASAMESIGRKLGDELIAAAIDTVREWDRLQTNPRSSRLRPLRLAMKRLKHFVGPP